MNEHDINSSQNNVVKQKVLNRGVPDSVSVDPLDHDMDMGDPDGSLSSVYDDHDDVVDSDGAHEDLSLDGGLVYMITPQTK